MGLVRATNPIATALIRRLGDGAGALTRDVTLEIDNLINWVKFAPRRIKVDTSVVGNVGAGLDGLHTLSLDTPNRLLTDVDELIVYYGGNFTANDTDKQVQAFFGGTAYESMGLADIDGATGWTIQARIIRLSSSAVRVNNTLMVNAIHGDSATPPVMTTFGVSFFGVSRSNDIGGLTLNGAITMEVKGQGAANDDVKQNMTSIWLIQQ